MGMRKHIKKLAGADKRARMSNDTQPDSETKKPQTFGSLIPDSSQTSISVSQLEKSLRSDQEAFAANVEVRSQPAPGYRSSLAVLQAAQANIRTLYVSSISKSPYILLTQHFTPRFPVSEADRATMYEGSLRKSRPQSIYSNFQPPPSLMRPQPVRYTSYVVREKRISHTSNAVDEDEGMIESSKQEIRQIKIQDVESTRNALRMAYQAFQIGKNTLSALSEQSARLRNAEHRLDQAGAENAAAARQIYKLNATNRLINCFNPFASAKREREDTTETITARQKHYQDRDAVRLDAWHAWKMKQVRLFVSVPLGPGASRCDLEARKKYQLEPDSEDEWLEDEIEDNLEETLHVVREARAIAMAQREEIGRQNRGLVRMNSEMDQVGDDLTGNMRELNWL